MEQLSIAASFVPDWNWTIWNNTFLSIKLFQKFSTLTNEVAHHFITDIGSFAVKKKSKDFNGLGACDSEFLTAENPYLYEHEQRSLN